MNAPDGKERISALETSVKPLADVPARLAVVEYEQKNLREQHKAQSDVIVGRLEKIDEKVDELTAVMNRGKGMFTAALLAAGVIGGAVTKLIGFLIGKATAQ